MLDNSLITWRVLLFYSLIFSSNLWYYKQLLLLLACRPALFIMKRQTDGIDTMPLIRRRVVTLTLEHMAQVPAAVSTDDLRPLHAERAVCMSGDGAGNAVEIGWPSTARFEFMVGGVERRVASGAVVATARRLVLVVLASEGGFGAFFSENAELFCLWRGVVSNHRVEDIINVEQDGSGLSSQQHTWIQYCSPLVFGSIVWIRHLFC